MLELGLKCDPQSTTSYPTIDIRLECQGRVHLGQNAEQIRAPDSKCAGFGVTDFGNDRDGDSDGYTLTVIGIAAVAS